MELDEPQVLQPVALGRSHRKDYRARMCGVLVAENLDPVFGHPVAHRVGGGRERRLRKKVETAGRSDDSFAKGDRGNMSLTHCAQGQDNPLGYTGEPRLIGMRAQDRKSTRLTSSHYCESRTQSSA